jgi:hypothetical protein
MLRLSTIPSVAELVPHQSRKLSWINDTSRNREYLLHEWLGWAVITAAIDKIQPREEGKVLKSWDRVTT